jgi:ABC-type Zn2+ transport system substrate-binding protein/surface adhesin
MSYRIALLVLGLMIIAPEFGIAAQPGPTSVLSRKRCEQPASMGENVVVGLYPLHVIVTKVDSKNATIDFITEVGTSLHVEQASKSDLKQLQQGDTVELCIVEELNAEAAL